ncbi:DUF6454 family protein [Aminobacter carboxidus]|uniref:Uncharacterized protein n=1 Tax=Aminobacter carboxidus TaxID=376165 RepID=A0ABR9GPA3_9HYPH|nr:DUF6454 family protein [Aminobacter carboxidus]MBE1205512.1 hypothetical protein [Aminobacter carboxidus]
MKRLFALLFAAACLAGATAHADDLTSGIGKLTRGTEWQLVKSPRLEFDTFHPQGFARVGEALFMSSVEIIERTKKFEAPQNGLDRDEGKGAGHLFKLDANGKLVGQVKLGDGAIYHPGGIDYDGRWLWVPVAEYRPNSKSIIYRVDPETLEATEVFRFPDHIGGIVSDPESGTLHAVSWGSRRFYSWKVTEDLTVPDAALDPEKTRTLNPSHYIDYQDCALAKPGQAVCTGLTEYRPGPDGQVFRLGGIETVDLKDGRPLFQVPIQIWTEKGKSIAGNPVLIEKTETGLRLTAAPEDNETKLYVYETKLP